MYINRLEWMDLLRGSCILFVILSHWMLMIGIDSPIFSNIFNTINDFFSPIRMELLFFMSGLLVKTSLKKGESQYFKGKVNNILYPYVIWASIFLALFLLKSLIVNTTSYSISDTLLGLLFGVKGSIWFLYSLFLFYIITPFLLKFNFIIVFILDILILFLLKKYNIINGFGFLYNDQNILNNFYYFIYFFIGAKFFTIKSNFIANKKILFISFLSLLSVFYISFYYDLNKTNFYYLLPVVLSFPSIFFISIYFSKYNGLLCRCIKHIGRNSIIYYIVHFYFFMGLMTFISIFKINSSFFSILSLILCIVFCYIIDILRSKYIFIQFLFSPFVVSRL